MKFIYAAILCVFFTKVEAQFLLGFHTEWDDSFREWIVVVENPDSTIEEGSLDVTWNNDRNFEEYTFRIGEFFGDIKQVFPNNPTNWQLTTGTELISIRSVWPSDPREWKISDGKNSFTIRTKYPGIFDEWHVRDESKGQFYLYTDIPGDLRDWIVEDYLKEDYSLAMRLAAAFIVIHVSGNKI